MTRQESITYNISCFSNNHITFQITIHYSMYSAPLFHADLGPFRFRHPIHVVKLTYYNMTSYMNYYSTCISVLNNMYNKLTNNLHIYWWNIHIYSIFTHSSIRSHSVYNTLVIVFCGMVQCKTGTFVQGNWTLSTDVPGFFTASIPHTKSTFTGRI